MTDNQGMELDASWTGVLMDIGKERSQIPVDPSFPREYGLLTGEKAMMLSLRSLQVITSGSVDWVNLLSVAVANASCSREDGELRQNLLTAAAVVVAWIEEIDRRSKNPAVPAGV
jgi:hypothetical protein